jgi:hypothetical protein
VRCERGLDYESLDAVALAMLAQRHKLDDLCVSLRHIWVAFCPCFTTEHALPIAVRIRIVVVTLDYSRP